MRIAFVSQPFDRLNPGAQNSVGLWTYEVARRLSRKASVTVYLARDPAHPVADHGGIQFRSIPITMDSRLVPLLERAHRKPWTGAPPFLSPLYFIEYALRVSRDLRRNPHDVVHAYNLPWYPAAIKGHSPSSRVVLNMTGEWLSVPGPAYLEGLLRKVDLFLGCSRHITGGLARAHPSASGRCQTVYNGTDLPGPPPEGARDRRRVLFVGRVSPEKGVHVLIEAFRRVVDALPEATLELVGSRRQLPRELLIDISTDPAVQELSRFYAGRDLFQYARFLENRIRELDLRDHVTMAGFLSHDRVLARCSRAAILANPSFSESFGIPVIEAMSRGTPVVAGRVGGMLESMTDGRTGYLVDPGNQNALAQRLLDLLSDEQLRRRMGEHGRSRVARYFTWDAISERVLDLYGELVESDDRTS